MVTGYASVYAVLDQHNDLIIKGAFALANTQDIKFLWQHDTQKPIGIIKSLSEDDYGLKIEAIINNKIEAGREAIELVRQGAVSGLSVGFNIIDSNYNQLGQRIIIKAELIEISIVTFPANDRAKISNIYYEKHKSQKENKMPISLPTTQENLIEENSNNFNYHEKSNSLKINMLETKIDNILSFLSRPDLGVSQDIEYKTAFNNYIRKGTEIELIKKSLGTSAEEGGVLIVPTLYQKIISGINARSPMRQLASIETISTNSLDIVIEDGKFVSGWIGDSESREVTDTPKLQHHKILTHELYAQPKASQTLIDDSAIQIENWLIERLQDSFVALENEAFINGSGDKKPKGILSPDHNNIQKLNAGKQVTTEMLLDLINLLDEEYLANATFLMNRVTLSNIQKLKDENGRFIWQQSLTEKLQQTIFGIPVICCSNMPTIANNSLSIALGDFKAAYKIVDRSGINIMRDPYTDKPFVKFYAVKRVGGDVVNQAAIKLAKFTDE